MSENIELWKKFLATMIPTLGVADSSVARKGMEETLALLDPDFVCPAAFSIPHGGVWRGHEGFVKMGETFREAWIHHGSSHEFFDLGDGRILIIIEPTFESKATGETITHKMIEIVTFRDGKITEIVPYYWDTVPLVEAGGGVVEAPWLEAKR